MLVRRIFPFGIAAALVILAAGCTRENKIPADAIVGTWLEVADNTPVADNPRIRKVARLTPELRKVTFNADGTFKMVLAKPDGADIEPTKAAEGKWTYDAGQWLFDVTKNTMADRLKEWAPVGFGGFFIGDKPNPKPGQCAISHANGDNPTYKRM